MSASNDCLCDRTELLAAIVDGEVRACRALLRATQAVEAALEPLDVEALDAAVAARAREMRNLQDLESRAEELRGSAFAPPEDLAERLALLRDIAQRIREADARAREAAQRATQDLRRELRRVANGRSVLKGYRLPTTRPPRFTDRKS